MLATSSAGAGRAWGVVAVAPLASAAWRAIARLRGGSGRLFGIRARCSLRALTLPIVVTLSTIARVVLAAGAMRAGSDLRPLLPPNRRALC